jgi:hypothetical protein
MVGLVLRSCILGGILASGGIVIFLQGDGGAKAPRNETYMEEKAPVTVEGVSYTRGSEHPAQSYRMDKGTYDTLQPYGIVCRKFDVGTNSVDTVLIASQQKGSFHDPRICFRAQGLVSEADDVAAITTSTRGVIPFTYSRYKSDQGGEQLVAYTYLGPYGFRSDPIQLKADIFKYQLMTGKNPDSVFYRFITDAATPDAKFKKFMKDYMDTAKQVSGGFF